MNEKLVRDALEIWEELSKDPESRFAFEARLKTMIDKEARIADAKHMGQKKAIEEGMKEGMEEGMEREKQRLAQNMLNMNMDIETIKEVTKITDVQIKQIQKEL